MADVKDQPRASGPDSGDRGPDTSGEPLGRLLHFAGRRPAAPARVVAEIKRTTYPAWQAKIRAVARARRRRRTWSLAAAAVLLIGVGLTWWRLAPGSPPAVRVARVEAAAGAGAGGWQAGGVTAGARLDAGSVIETGPGGFASLRLAGGTSARLDAGTVVRLDTATTLALDRGAVYLDTESATSGSVLEVVTPHGVARDIGTQFEVRLFEDGLKIQVREGDVEVDLDGAVHAAGAGTALTVGTGGVTRDAVPAHGSAWEWVLRTSPPFELEGRTLGELLHWVSRETGWRVRFADPGLEREIADTVAHGSIGDARADQVPDLVLPGFGLRHRREDGVLWIEQAGAAP